MRYRLICTACLVWSAMMVTAPVTAADSLTPHSAEYKVKISVLRGTLKTRLKVTDGGYEATHSVAPAGLAKILVRGTIVETSGFDSADGGVLPTRYVSSDTLSKNKTQTDVTFDWSTGAVNGTVNEEHIERVLEEIAHDRVSIQYQLMYDLMNGGPRKTYLLFDVDRLKTLNVTTIGEKEVKVPAGKFTALGIQHQAEGSSRITTLWCVEELDYLPVIIEQHRKGKLRMRATLKKYTPESS